MADRLEIARRNPPRLDARSGVPVDSAARCSGASFARPFELDPAHEEVRQRGSDEKFRHRAGRATSVPYRPGRDLSPFRFAIPVRQIDPPDRSARSVGRIAKDEDIGLPVEDLFRNR
jgi:hypothetical protein